MTQGTVANRDFGQVVAPALVALGGRQDVTIIVATGGQPAESIPVALRGIEGEQTLGAVSVNGSLHLTHTSPTPLPGLLAGLERGTRQRDLIQFSKHGMAVFALRTTMDRRFVTTDKTLR